MRSRLTGLWVAALLLCGVAACGDDDDNKDMEMPEISAEGIVANPVDCQQYRRGEVIAFNYVFTDNVALGSYNIEIHHNFDHHTHSTSATECPQEPTMDSQTLKDLEQNHRDTLWVYNESFTIEGGKQRFVARQDINVPANIHPGDYHFMIRVKDQAGWQQLKAMAVKIVE